MLLLPLFLGCTHDILLGDDSARDPSGDDSTPLDSVPGETDTEGPVDSADSADSADTGDAGVPFFTPAGGTFVDPLQVTLDVHADEQAWYTTDGSLPSARSTAYTAPIDIRAGTELRVLVRDSAGEDSFHARSYVRLDADVSDFTSNLPLVILYSPENLDDAAADYLPISLQVHDVGDDGRAHLLGAATTSNRAAVKERGSSTAYDDKHSYALELRELYSDDDDSEPLLDMPAESDWVLYAPLDFDRALVRNALMYRLSNDLGRYAPRTRFVEVYSVGRGRPVGTAEYQGVYVLMEKITISPDRVAIDKLTSADVAEPEVSGGYLFKRDRVGADESGFFGGEAGGAFTFADPLVYVDPKEQEIEREQSLYLRDAVDDMANAMAAADHTYEGVHYRDLIDQDAWIDHHILNNYAKNPDALRLSAYIYKERNGPIVTGPIWDFDRAMGCTDDDRALDPTWWDATNITSDTTDMFEYGWYLALFDDPEFTAAYFARFDELLDDTLSDAHVGSVLDEMEAELAEAAPRNYDRWSAYRPTTGSFEGEIEALRSWLEARHAWIDTCLRTHADDPQACHG